MFKSFCYICFSKYHDIKDCIDAVPNLFPPNIDQNLFARFLELLVIEEKLFLIFTDPRIFTSVAIKSIKIMQRDNINFASLMPFMDSDVIIADCAEVKNPYFSFLKSRIVFRIERLDISSYYIRKKFSPNELFLLLTFKTKTLSCRNIDFYPKVDFCQIVEAAPALEEIDIYETNIAIDSTWVDLLSKLRNLKTLSLTILNLNIKVANLAAFIKGKANNVRINLYIIAQQNKGAIYEYYAFKIIEKQLSSHFFVNLIPHWNNPLRICFKYNDAPPGFYNFMKFKCWEQ